MKAIVVYESLWGNTAAIARAIAEGLGPEARALSTAAATPDAFAGAELIVAGSPLFAFQLPTDAIRETINQKFERNFVKYIKFTLDRREVPQEDQSSFKQMIQKIAPENDND